MIAKTAWTVYRRLKGLQPYREAVLRHRQMHADQARADLARRLMKQIKYFGNRGDALPQWRDAIRLEDAEELWRIWPKLPIVTKHDLQTRFSPDRMHNDHGVRGISSSTGGSTGEPTPYLHDRKMLTWATASRLSARIDCGWRPGMATICVWGSERDIGRQRNWQKRASSLIRNDWLVAGYSLSQQTVDQVVRLINGHQEVALFGFSSMLEFLAESILQRGIELKGRVAAAWNGGEMLHAEQADVFQRAFGVRLHNCYGGRELSAMALQVAGRQSLLVMRPYSLVEIVDDAGNPCSPGESGRLIWTSTVCRGTPFLRYEIGDVGACNLSDQDGSGVRAITELNGRTAGLLKLPTGKTISCLFWNHFFKDFSEVRQFQVAIRSNYSILLRLKGTAWTPSREAHARQLLQNLLGVPVEVLWVEQIPRTRQGKLVQVVREAV